MVEARPMMDSMFAKTCRRGWADWQFPPEPGLMDIAPFALAVTLAVCSACTATRLLANALVVGLDDMVRKSIVVLE
jgi:hypothetical protein